MRKYLKNIINGSLDIEFLMSLNAFVNNSIIGTSKLLRFCNPTMYAIYDTNVYKLIICREKVDYNEVNSIAKYIGYTEKLRALSKDPDFIQDLKNILQVKNMDIANTSQLRCIEMCLFYSIKEARI